MPVPARDVEHFAREDGRVPDVGDLQVGYQFEGFRPVSPPGERKIGPPARPPAFIADGRRWVQMVPFCQSIRPRCGSVVRVKKTVRASSDVF